jgi:hypothetical protein
MTSLLWVFFTPHITITGMLIYLILNEQRSAEARRRAKTLRNFSLSLKKSSNLRYREASKFSASPMRNIARSSIEDIRDRKLNKVRFLTGGTSFNINSPLRLFTTDNQTELISLSTMKRYNVLSRRPREINNINNISNELSEKLCRRAAQKLLYAQCLSDIESKVAASLVKKQYQLSSPMRNFARNNRRTIESHSYNKKIRSHAQAFLDARGKGLQYRELYTTILRDLIMKQSDRRALQSFKMQHNIGTVELSAQSKTIFTMMFPDDKVYCHRFLADCNIEGFEAHVEYLASDKIRNYCTLQLTNMTPDEIIEFTRKFTINFDHNRVTVQTDNITQHDKIKKVTTCDFIHKEAISTKAFEKYQKSVAPYCATVTYLNKFNGSEIRVEAHDIVDLDQLLKKFKGLIHKKTTTMVKWIDI